MINPSGKCQWVKGNGDRCLLPTSGKQYCYSHAPLARIHYERGNGLPEPLDQSLDSTQDPNKVRNEVEKLRKKWKKQLEEDIKTESTKGKTLTKKDFPNYYGGIFYQTIEEYHAYNSGYTEMPGTDQQPRAKVSPIQDYRKYAPDPKPKQSSSTTTYSSYDPLKGKNGYYIEKDSIAHMRYIVYRDNNGKYFAVFISLWKPTTTVEDIMAVVDKTALPSLQPTVIGDIGQFHTGKAHTSFSSAEGQFTTGGESLWRIKDRMKKVADPNWIPPNLRALIIETTYDKTVFQYIPKHEIPRLKKWLAAGCPGWHGKQPKGKHKGGSSKGYSSGYSGSGQTSLFSSSLDKHGATYASSSYSKDAVWDGEIGMWISNRKRIQ